MISIADAFKNSFLDGFSTSLSTMDIVLGLAVSLAAGLFILLIYRMAMRKVAFNRSFCITLLLVCAISAMVVLTITSNLALSLGMVGALSIIRFRTAIKDASDTAFMFWAVAAGITAGAGFYLLTLIGCLFVGLICIIVICKLTGVIVGGDKTPAQEAPAAAPAPAAPVAVEIPNKQELVAAVSAAIAEDMGTDVSAIRILSIKRL